MRTGIRIAQASIGLVQLAAGGVQAVEGVFQAGAGLFAAPASVGGSLLVVAGGVVNTVVGSAAVLDGGMMISSAVSGSGDPATTFGLAGQRYGGEIGGQVGELVNIGALTAALAAGTKNSRIGTLASAIAAQALSNVCAISGGNQQ